MIKQQVAKIKDDHYIHYILLLLYIDNKEKVSGLNRASGNVKTKGINTNLWYKNGIYIICREMDKK